MATKLEEIRDILKTKMQSLVDGESNPLLQDVFDYPTGPGNLEKYPVAVILPTGGSEGETKDTGRNLRMFNFDIFIYQEQTPSGKNKETANDTMTKVVDAVLIAFDRDYNLNFEVSRVHVVGMEFDYVGVNGPYITAKIKVEVEVLVQNY